MKTINQQLWSKEVRRIRNFIKRASKRGFEFDANIIPEMPKRVTKKALQELRRQTTPNRLYMQATYHLASGQTTTGLRGRQIERQAAARKAARTRAEKGKIKLPSRGRLTLDNFLRTFTEAGFDTTWSAYMREMKTEDRNRAVNMVERAVAQFGEEIVAQRIQNNAMRISELAERIAWDSKPTEVNLDLNELAVILFNGAFTLEQSIQYTSENDML